MSIQREEAAQALRDAEAAADRSSTAVGYQRVSGFLILWGIVWGALNLAAFFRMPNGGLVFPALMLVGVVGSFILGMRAGGDGLRRNSAARSLVIAFALMLFSFGMQVVAQITSFATAEAIICLAIGAAYMILGLSTGWRLTAVGLVLMLSVIGGWLYAREQFFLWMTLAGGGGLVLGGLWLRKA